MLAPILMIWITPLSFSIQSILQDCLYFHSHVYFQISYKGQGHLLVGSCVQNFLGLSPEACGMG